MRRVRRLALPCRAASPRARLLRPALAASLVCAAAAPCAAQEPAPVYQQQKSLTFVGDALARYEWTKDLPGTDGPTDESRWRLQARPRLELAAGPLAFGVGGEFNYSQDENYQEADGSTPPIIRDNYKSRDARLDLAFGRLKLGPVVAQGGRFFMPLPLTEMVWDKDLRPQGGAVGLQFGTRTRLSLTGLYAKGSHVFEDESVMFGGGVELKLASGRSGSFQAVGSYLQFEDLDKLDPAIRRQNTRIGGRIVNDYRVVDVLGRLSSSGQVPVTLVADYCWNTAMTSGNRGLWLAVALGSTELSRARAEYTYAKIDRDAVVAAFDTDDFFWGTGWEGHRADIATSAAKTSSMHAIAQWQRFKDSPDPVARETWVKRYRLELRMTF
jgi:hypothetical protein